MKTLRHLILTLALLALANALPLHAQTITSRVPDFGSTTTEQTGPYTSQTIPLNGEVTFVA